MTLPIIRSQLPRPYVPAISAHSKRFWEALENGEFLLGFCKSCSQLQFPPRPECSSCLGTDIGWQPSPGRGELYAATRIHAAGGPFACMTPYSVGIVDLDERVRILLRLLHDASSLTPASAVQLAVVQHTDGPLFAAIAATGSTR